MEIKDIKNKIEKATIAVATANKQGNPHNIVIMYAKLKNGKAEYYDSGKWLDFVKSLDENKDYSPKGAVVVNVEEIREVG